MLAWHYHDDDLAGPDAEVNLSVENLPIANEEVRIEHFRVDEDHSNGFTAWKRMGSPQAPNPVQYAALEQAGHLALIAPPGRVPVSRGRGALSFRLPRQAVSLLRLSW